MPGNTNFSALRYSLQTEAAIAQTGFSNLANDLDEKVIPKTSGAPTNNPTSVGTLYYDTADNIWKRWDGASWKWFVPVMRSNLTDLTLSVNNTTLANATGFSWPLTSGRKYVLRGFVRVTEPSGQDTNVKFGWTAPTIGAVTSTWNATSTGTNGDGVTFASSLGVTINAFPNVATVTFSGFIHVASTGTLQLQWAKNASAGTQTITLNAGSWIELLEL